MSRSASNQVDSNLFETNPEQVLIEGLKILVAKMKSVILCSVSPHKRLPLELGTGATYAQKVVTPV